MATFEQLYVALLWECLYAAQVAGQQAKGLQPCTRADFVARMKGLLRK